nr:hypothetical protein Iba_chr10eCG6680 [Ipomoea batatas]
MAYRNAEGVRGGGGLLASAVMEAAVTTADWLRKSSAVPTANVACGCGAYCSTANILLWKEWRMLSGTCKWETKEIGKWSSGVVESVNLIGIRKRNENDNLTICLQGKTAVSFGSVMQMTHSFPESSLMAASSGCSSAEVDAHDSATITSGKAFSPGMGFDRSFMSKKPKSTPVPEGWQNFWPNPFWNGTLTGFISVYTGVYVQSVPPFAK